MAADTVEMLLSAWGPHERSVYACSPHRIEMLGRLVRGDFHQDEGNAVLRMLPDWVQWCIDQAGLAGDIAAHALKAASAESANPAPRTTPPTTTTAPPSAVQNRDSTSPQRDVVLGAAYRGVPGPAS